MDRIELFQAISLSVELFNFFKLEVFNEAWVQILKLRWRCEFLRQQQMLEGDWKRGLCMEPSVRDDLDKVLGWHWLIQRHRERDSVLVTYGLLLQDKLLVVQDLLRITIFNVDPERFSSAMVSLVPDERSMGSKIKLNPYQGASDWLDVGFKLEARKLVDLIQDSLTHLGEADNVTNLMGIHVVKVVPLELGLLLNLASNVVEMHHLCELAEGRH